MLYEEYSLQVLTASSVRINHQPKILAEFPLYLNLGVSIIISRAAHKIKLIANNDTIQGKALISEHLLSF